jgi:hypothetical protein
VPVLNLRHKAARSYPQRSFLLALLGIGSQLVSIDLVKRDCLFSLRRFAGLKSRFSASAADL